ncbi:MAG: glycosyltransferase family 39 protein [Vicinamibacteria bacterium]|jgi:hypothetical protein|nr:glycosyltransferase family 39 protein [Vicinamibacteria bacterium]
MTLPRPAVARALAVAAGVALVASASWTADRYYFGHSIRQGSGMDYLLPEELAHHANFRLFALPALLLLAFGLAPLARGFLPAMIRLAKARRVVPLLAAAWIAACGLAVSQQVLSGSPITDDEQVMSFMGQVLRSGALVAPAPAIPREEWPFLREQFVAVTERGRFGQYTLGQPLALALGQALSMEWLVVPLISAALPLVLYAVGRRLTGPGVAGLAVLMVAASPQVLLTAGTKLSQPLSALCLMLATWALATADRPAGPRPAIVALAGLALGAGILVRPLPGVLLVAAAAAWLVAGHPGWSARQRTRALLVLVACAAWGVVAVLVTNTIQSGHPLLTAYQAARPHLDPGAGGLARIAGAQHGLEMRVYSLLGNLMRLDLWLLGWPGALLLALFARRRRGTALAAGLVAAVLLYRLVVPKQGVAPTGPVYLYEAVPLLCLLMADGLRQMARGPRWLSQAPAALLAGSLLAVTLFVPTKLRDLHLQGEAHAVPRRVLAQVPGKLAIFYRRFTADGSTWAYYAPPNPPGQDNRVLFFRLRETPGGDPTPSLAFARRHFPDRLAIVLRWEGETLHLERLDQYVARRTAGSP